MKFTIASMLVATALASPAAEIKTRQSCPPLHVFGARETTVPPGYGTSATIVNAITSSRSGSTASAIEYPACGGQANCGGTPYEQSVVQGTAAVAQAVNDMNTQCPDTVMVLVGYSQGGQIIDLAFCGQNGQVPINEAASSMVAAAVFMGAPTYVAGFEYNVGTCTAQGFNARQASFECPVSDRVRSYCDNVDPYCCTGNDANAHQQYANKYNSDIMDFINEKLDEMLA